MLRRASQSLASSIARRQGQAEPLMEMMQGPAVQNLEGYA
jgi:hypothetical protein